MSIYIFVALLYLLCSNEEIALPYAWLQIIKFNLIDIHDTQIL